MKKIFLGLATIALISGTVIASTGGGKKKARKKAKTECKVENCDPKNCDPKNCDPKNCSYTSAVAETKCVPASCSGN